MNSPTPRDSLGRIVYAGDVLACGATVERILPSGGIGVVFPNGGVSGFSSCYETVDLAASPSRTNHERYFADLGTRDEVVAAFHSISCQEEEISCFECPFRMVAGECCFWPYWLYERAEV